MPSVGRKLLLAGKGGLNLTHGEPFDAFVARYGPQRATLEPMLRAFGPEALRAWARELGIETFVGSSGRVFPVGLKAAPLLRAWVHRLRSTGVAFHMRYRWVGWVEEPGGVTAGCTDGAEGAMPVPVDRDGAGHAPPVRLRFESPIGEVTTNADAVVFALGGASWPQLGSDGAWVGRFEAHGIGVAPLAPSNGGFDVGRGDGSGAPRVGWSDHFRTRFAGAPLKNVALAITTVNGFALMRLGEFVVTETGVEGSLVYALSAAARHAIETRGVAAMTLDLLPARSIEVVRAEVARPRGSRSLATHLKSRLGLDGVKAALLHELLPREAIADVDRLATSIKALPLRWVAARPLAEAISTAGGVRFDRLTDGLMAASAPGIFCAGEMLDWEAPTGGYLLSACFATGRRAAESALDHLRITD